MNKIFPWQQTQWQYLLTRHNKNNLPHAILLTGTQGLGKLVFAQTLSALLLCKNPQDFACGSCQACHLIKVGTHSDFIAIHPEETGKSIKVEQIRQLTDTLNKTSQQGGRQVVIIEPAEAMNIAASNALLKTLEEPQGQVILILVCHQATSLSATIRSRCQQIIFDVAEKSIIKNWLTQQLTADKNAELLLALSEYAPLKALEFSNQDHLEKFSHFVKNICQLNLKNPNPVKLASTCSDMELPEILSILAIMFADIIRSKFTNELQFFSNQDNLELLTKFGQGFSLKKLFNLQDKIAEIKRLMTANINFNKQLLLEDLFIQISLSSSLPTKW